MVDADLSKYFDTIPHSDLLKSVARRIVDRHVLRLIKLWLKAPVEEREGDGKRHMSGGRRAKCGTPQGGVASPLSGILCARPVSSLADEPLAEDNGELGLGLEPFARRSFPFLSRMVQDQI
ncbi:reverse transcriptase domain-containing protein [Mesorhizobium sp. M0902]|uniref:reverse transcriptase domain-containing protein n=1 Tax=Mesorhizobium sp. M0902 TaxID=2957021 RepID=UPI00333D012E